MKQPKEKFFSWRLKLILTLGGVAGLVLLVFGDHVASISDLPNGPTPLSWGFKTKVAQVAAFFSTEAGVNGMRVDPPGPPPIDLEFPEQTETALFALG
jgi:hypothetical protein